MDSRVPAPILSHYTTLLLFCFSECSSCIRSFFMSFVQYQLGADYVLSTRDVFAKVSSQLVSSHLYWFPCRITWCTVIPLLTEKEYRLPFPSHGREPSSLSSSPSCSSLGQAPMSSLSWPVLRRSTFLRTPTSFTVHHTTQFLVHGVSHRYWGRATRVAIESHPSFPPELDPFLQRTPTLWSHFNMSRKDQGTDAPCLGPFFLPSPPRQGKSLAFPNIDSFPGTACPLTCHI